MKGVVYVHRAAGWDLLDPRPHLPMAGTRVKKVQPAGCPLNGTLHHCFIADADTGVFIGLVA